METIGAELVDTGAKRDGRGRRLAVREEAQAALAAYESSGLTQRETEVVPVGWTGGPSKLIKTFAGRASGLDAVEDRSD